MARHRSRAGLRTVRRWPAVLLAAGLLGLSGSVAAAAGEPALASDRSAAGPGDRIMVRLAGWMPGNVIIEVCGNEAYAGSADCAIDMSVNAPVGTDGIGRALVRIVVPPSPCPCVLRGRSLTDGAVRTAALRIRGARTGKGRPAAYRAAGLTIVAARLRGGPGLAALLGGPARRELAVTVRNTGAAPVPQPRLAVTVGRPGRPTTVVDCPPAGVLGPGQERTLGIPVTFGAPTWGRYTARVEITGGGRPVVGHAHTRSYPWGLLFVPLAVIALRVLRRRSGTAFRPSGGAVRRRR